MQAYHRDMDERIRYGRPAGESRTGRRMFHHLRAAGAPALAAGSSDWVVYAGQDGNYPGDEAYFLRSILNTIQNALRIARTGWIRRTWPAGWPSAVGSWLRASWSTSPTSLISRAVRRADPPLPQPDPKGRKPGRPVSRERPPGSAGPDRVGWARCRDPGRGGGARRRPAAGPPREQQRSA